MKLPLKKSRPLHSPSVWLLLAVPCLLVLYKQLPWESAASLRQFMSLAAAPPPILAHFRDAAMVPLGALIVCLFRISLGLRVLSFFRPILLAIAFQSTGFAGGTLMLSVAVAVMYLARPHVKAAYFARMGISLALVSTILAIPFLVGRQLQAESVAGWALFPVVALCLTCESFAEVANKSGAAFALRRSALTLLCAAAIVLVGRIPGLLDSVLAYPEWIVFQAGLIAFIDRALGFRLWDKKANRRRTRRKKTPRVRIPVPAPAAECQPIARSGAI